MQHKPALLIALLSCLSLFASAALAQAPWFLPWFSKDQHIYVCGSSQDYGMTPEELVKLETDLDHLSSVYGIDLYFSVSCTNDVSATTREAYTDLLTRTWTRNQLPTEKRVVISIIKDWTSQSPAYWSAYNYNLPNECDIWLKTDKDGKREVDKAIDKFISGKPYLAPVISYLTLATEDCVKSHASADAIATGEARWKEQVRREQSDAQEKANIQAAQEKRTKDEEKAKRDAMYGNAGIAALITGVAAAFIYFCVWHYNRFYRRRGDW